MCARHLFFETFFVYLISNVGTAKLFEREIRNMSVLSTRSLDSTHNGFKNLTKRFPSIFIVNHIHSNGSFENGGDIAFKYMGIFCLEYYLLSAFGSLQEPKRQSHKFSMQITISKITLPTSIVLAHIALASIVSASSRKQSFEDFPSSSFFFYTNVRTAILMQCRQLYGKLLFYP